jgi:DNA-binding NtrC family response regulator
MNHRVLVVDDEPRFRDLYASALRAIGLIVIEAEDVDDALAVCDKQAIDMIVSDVRMPGRDGLQLLQALRARQLQLPVLLVTAHADIRGAVDSMKLGAVDYLEKPVDLDELVAAVSDSLALEAEVEGPVLTLPAAAMAGIVAEDPKTRLVFAEALRVASTDATVLIGGESGSGKEVLTRFIHEQGSRRGGPLVAVNCAAIPHELLASEFFGHRRGAFTGADQDRIGRFQQADGGTLFLDEIGEMPWELQTLLLRAIETRRITPVGGQGEQAVDVRLIAASHVDLATAVRAGRFREDLFYRLNVFSLNLPPLRERPADIIALARHFLGAGKRLSPAAETRLRQHGWPGNVRELANAMERARIMAGSDIVLPEHLPPALSQASPPLPSAALVVGSIADAEKIAISRALEETAGNRTRAAEILGISRRALIYKLKTYNLS